MPADAAPSILRRMLKPAPASVSGAAITAARAWRMSLPRAAEKAAELVAAVSGVDVAETDLETVLSDWDGFVLALALRGPGEARGLALTDAPLRAALIEVQTLGRVLRQKLSDRASTPVDAALAGHVIDAWIAAFEAASGAAGAAEGEGWRAGEMIADTRAARLAVDDGEYRVQDLTVLLGDGARTGRLRLVTPFGAPVASPGAERPRGGRSALYEVEAELHAVLYRTAVPYRWLADLAPGALLEVPAEALGAVRVEDSDGRAVAHARLGKSQGMRALRLLDGVPGPEKPPRPMPRLAAGTPASRPRAAASPVMPEPAGALPTEELPELVETLPDRALPETTAPDA